MHGILSHPQGLHHDRLPTGESASLREGAKLAESTG
jgi:hypothetical protein